jgi:hypothetical protein
VKKGILIIFILLGLHKVQAQKIDSLFFNLYTDSLKKGTNNYINLDAKLVNGNWIPLTSDHLIFSSSYGYFDKNDLVLPDSPTCDFVKVKAVLRSDTTIQLEKTIWIKKLPDDEYLPTNEEILREMMRESGRKKKKNG